MFKTAFYMCFKCKNPYFGGLAECGNEIDADQEYRKEDFICPTCSVGAKGLGETNCEKHGT